MMTDYSSFGRNLESWISVQSITDHSIQVRYGLPPDISKVSAVLSGDGFPSVERTGGGNIGQLCFSALPAGTHFRLVFCGGGHVMNLEVDTLPAPPGKRLFSLMMISDPHLSCSSTDKCGRLHSASPRLLEQQLSLAEERGCDMILVPGDFTDAALPEEYRLLDSVLGRNILPLWATPGNHDLMHDAGQGFRMRFGDGAGLRVRDGFQLAAFDTGDGHFNKPRNIEILNRLDPEMPLIAMTHFQLFPDSWIPDEDKVIFDQDQSRPYLDRLSRFKGILYVGHKNVAALVQTGHLIQLNLPQLTHFPAGCLQVDVFEHSIRHFFVPITDEELNERSRLGTEAAPYHSHPLCACKSAYRDGYTQYYWNKEIKL